MNRFFLILLLLAIGPSAHAVRLCDLLFGHVPPSPTATVLMPANLDPAEKARLMARVQALVQLNADLNKHLFVPDVLKLEVTTGKHYLGAVCYPCDQRVVVDKTLFDQHGYVADGILGHENGHAIFQASMEKLLDKYLRANSSVPRETLQKQFSDSAQVRSKMKELEGQYPALALLDVNPYPGELPAYTVALYKTLAEIAPILEKREQANEKDSVTKMDFADPKVFARFLVLHQMDGFHEIFADLIGAIHTNDANYMAKVLNDPTSVLIRGTVTDDDLDRIMANKDLRDDLVKHAAEGIPHLTLFWMHRQINKNFYQKVGRRLGDDRNYDAKVAQEVLDSIFNAYVYVMVDAKTGPEPRTNAATLAMTYAAVATQADVEIRERAEALARAMPNPWRTSYAPPATAWAPPVTTTTTAKKEKKEQEVVVEQAAGGMTRTNSMGRR